MHPNYPVRDLLAFREQKSSGHHRPLQPVLNIPPSPRKDRSMNNDTLTRYDGRGWDSQRLHSRGGNRRRWNLGRLSGHNRKCREGNLCGLDGRN